MVHQKLTVSSLSNLMRVIVATRERLAGEIVPVRAEQSSTKDDNEEKYGADRAIDLDLTTRSTASSGADGSIWFKVNIDQVSCVDQIVIYDEDGNRSLTWTCSKTDCSTCEGKWCASFSLTVYREGAVDNVPSVSGCKYGDTVKLQLTVGGGLYVKEISITEKEGEIIYTGR